MKELRKGELLFRLENDRYELYSIKRVGSKNYTLEIGFKVDKETLVDEYNRKYFKLDTKTANEIFMLKHIKKRQKILDDFIKRLEKSQEIASFFLKNKNYLASDVKLIIPELEMALALLNGEWNRI